ncbi:hypothetical protein VSDG_00520 [Cytospora chrysosperma]|uniref:Uncharacterized protein n=1 Tax=Cytospora chrysosperma TaxID=252740 RepID=A0A423WPJ9_CYTCH|nr:hypothetical protein VSDG_00520 [Valsa sordida]
MADRSKQEIYHRGKKSYLAGPALLPNGDFVPYCAPYSIPAPKAIERLAQAAPHSHVPCGQDTWRDLVGFKATLPCTKTLCPVARGNILKGLWLTIYPYVEQIAGSESAKYGNTRIFHIRPAPANQPAPDALTVWQKLGFSEPSNPAPLSKWQNIMTINQVSLASKDASCSSKDEFFMNVGGCGAMFRSQADVVYLDKSFWKQFFEGCLDCSDDLIPGVYPDDLRKVQNVAIDIAVLRNTREFEAVVNTIVRRMPNVKNFLAVMTSMKARPEHVPRTVVAVLNKTVDQEANEEIKASLGLHDDPFQLSPPVGVVGSNLRRLGFMGLPNCQWRYVLLTYYQDTFQGLYHDVRLDLYPGNPEEEINETEADGMKEYTAHPVDAGQPGPSQPDISPHSKMNDQMKSITQGPTSTTARFFSQLNAW